MKASSAPLLVSAIMLGVKDVDRAKKRPWVARSTKTPRVFVRCSLGEGSSVLVLYEWEAAAQDAGVSAPLGGGHRLDHRGAGTLRGLHDLIHLVPGVGDEVERDAAEPGSLRGYFGYFSDPDGYLWKVTTAA